MVRHVAPLRHAENVCETSAGCAGALSFVTAHSARAVIPICLPLQPFRVPVLRKGVFIFSREECKHGYRGDDVIAVGDARGEARLRGRKLGKFVVPDARAAVRVEVTWDALLSEVGTRDRCHRSAERMASHDHTITLLPRRSPFGFNGLFDFALDAVEGTPKTLVQPAPTANITTSMLAQLNIQQPIVARKKKEQQVPVNLSLGNISHNIYGRIRSLERDHDVLLARVPGNVATNAKQVSVDEFPDCGGVFKVGTRGFLGGGAHGRFVNPVMKAVAVRRHGVLRKEFELLRRVWRESCRFC